MHKTRESKGITFIELLVTVAIIITVMGPVSILFNYTYKNYYVTRDTVDIHQSARYAMDMILADLARYNSSKIFINAEGGLVIVPGSLVYQRNGNTIIKKNPSELSEVVICEDVYSFKANINSSLDDPLVELEIEIKKGRGRKVSLQNAYRIKSEI